MANHLSLESKIEALLFFKGEPVSIKKICELVESDEKSVIEALKIFEQNLKDRGLALIYHEKSVLLGTSPEASSLIEKITKEEIARDLGKAGLETLAIILYKGVVSKREIDYIRGVNSNFIVRNLLIRGLVERIDNEEGRGFAYKPTHELLGFLGISKIEELPEYDSILKTIEEFNNQEKGVGQHEIESQ